MDICLDKKISENNNNYKYSTIALGILFGLSFITAIIFAIVYFKLKK